MDIRNFFKQVPKDATAPSTNSGNDRPSQTIPTQHTDDRVQTQSSSDRSKVVKLPPSNIPPQKLATVQHSTSLEPAGGPTKRGRSKYAVSSSSESEYSTSSSGSDDFDSDSDSELFSGDSDDDDDGMKTTAKRKPSTKSATKAPPKPSQRKTAVTKTTTTRAASPKPTTTTVSSTPATPKKPTAVSKPQPTPPAPSTPASTTTAIATVATTAAIATAATPTKTTVSLAPAKSTIPPWIAGASRGPPPLRGLKKTPIGEPNCLGYGGGGKKKQASAGTGKGNPDPLTFVISGVLDSLERDECEHLIKSLGGRVTSAVSGKTDYLILGTDGGASKKTKAESVGTAVIDEDGLFKLIIDRSPSINQDNSASTSSSSSSSSSSLPSSQGSSSSQDTPAAAPKKGSLYARRAAAAAATTGTTSSTTSAATPATGNISAPQPANLAHAKKLAAAPDSTVTDLWVDRYKPSDTSHIIGNGTAVNEIVTWLKTWHSQLAQGKFDGKEKDAPKRAILLSGGPGIGKTTAAVLCAKKAGLKPIEFNASDTRSKNSIAAEIGVLSNNKTLNLFMPGKGMNSNTRPQVSSSKSSSSSNGSVIIMDEVDGVSASDRGGIAELIKIIKSTTTPIICICNDANSDKIKSLKNYCRSYTWRKPTAAVIASRLCELAASENMDIDRNTMEQLVSSTHGDIRQAINMLQLLHLTRKGTAITYNDMRMATDHSQKDFDLGPYDVVPSFFRPGYGTSWMNEAINRYFVSDLIPFFVQENYLRARLNTGYAKLQQTPVSATGSMNSMPVTAPSPTKYSGDAHNMLLLSMASDSISESDVINAALMQEQNYSLMPLYGVMSSIYPGYIMSGGLSGMVEFPRLLGKTSAGNKMVRAVILFRALLSLSSVLTRRDAVCWYLPTLHRKIIELIKGNISVDEKFKKQHEMSHVESVNGPECAAALLAYLSMQKDDYDLFNELMDNLIMDVNKDHKYASLATNLKTALTRALNKSSVPQRMSKSKNLGSQAQATRKTLTEDEEFELANNEVQTNGDDDDDDENGGKDNDAAFIKASQVKTTTRKTTAKKASTATKKPRKA